MKKVIGYVSLVFGFFLSACSSGNGQEYKSISASSTDSLLKTDSNIIVIDVRSPEEFMSATGHLKNAKLIPVQDIESRSSELEKYKDRTIVAYCQSGRRSARAAAILCKKGFTIVNMQGGISSWNAQGLPTVKGVTR